MNDSTLKQLQIASLNSKQSIELVPAFAKERRAYNATLHPSDKKIRIKFACTESDAFGRVIQPAPDNEGNINLKIGDTEVLVEVEAPDGSKSLYAVIVTLPSGVEILIQNPIPL
jgi:hypothetical protein